MNALHTGIELQGTAGQIGWAELIRPIVEAEFRRVSSAFHAVAGNQDQTNQTNTGAILAILEEKRLEVLANPSAGYYIRDWGELGDQVRRLLAADPRYQVIKARREARISIPRHSSGSSQAITEAVLEA